MGKRPRQPLIIPPASSVEIDKESSCTTAVNTSTTPGPPKPIPPFYCSYLLRSTVRHDSLYIGSTPNPARRLAQHNGLVRGGAHRTASEKLRPWEMVVVVNGFTSRIGALQFEWAWQNTHKSRHAQLCERTSTQRSTIPFCSGTCRQKARADRSRVALMGIMAHLHLLLRSAYFSIWPLEVRFSSAEVYRVWQAWCEHVDGCVPDGIKVVVDLKSGVPGEAEQPNRPIGTGMVDSLKIGYGNIKEYLKKSQLILDDGERVNCAVCKGCLHLEDDLIVVCPERPCRGAFHVLCLSSKFLADEGIGTKVIPTNGQCPACHSELEWVTLMRELSLRTWGKKEMEKLLKPRRCAPPSSSRGQWNHHIHDEDEDCRLENMHIPNEIDLACGDDGTVADSKLALSRVHDRKGLNRDSDGALTTQLDSDSYLKNPWTLEFKYGRARTGAVVDGSDWDDVEILD